MSVYVFVPARRYFAPRLTKGCAQLIDIITSNNALLPDDMYAALDRALMQSKSSDGYDEFSLLTSLSDSIALRVRREYRLPIITHKRKRHSPVDAPLPTIAIEEEVVFDNAPEGQSEIISLPIPDATIGTTSYAMDEDDENIYSREKRLFGIEKELWLDRYLCANRAAISKGRAVMSTLASEREASEDKRDVLAKTSVRHARSVPRPLLIFCLRRMARMRSSFFGRRWSTSRQPNPTIRSAKLAKIISRKSTPRFCKSWRSRSLVSHRAPLERARLIRETRRIRFATRKESRGIASGLFAERLVQEGRTVSIDRVSDAD